MRILSLTLLALLSLTVQSSTVKWTYYAICFEDEESGSGKKDTTLSTCSGKAIAKVTRHYAERVHMEGTGKLLDGRVVNIGNCDCDDKTGNYNCFDVIDAKKFPWGKGSNDNPIYPYVSIASNDQAIGTTAHIPELVGAVLPGTNGQKHDGCVRVDDKGWSFGGNHFDFFVARMSYYEELDKALGEIENVTVQKKACKPQTYKVTGVKLSDEEPELIE